MFFFEKKNQKILDSGARVATGSCANLQKFFASFFQKRRPFFSDLGLQ
jgi:hypothetical protein